MSDSKTTNSDPADPNANVAGTGCDTPCTWLNQAEDFARREPTKAVAYAFSAGLLLHLLPARTTAAVACTLARPVLLCLGLLKAWELCPCKKESKN